MTNLQHELESLKRRQSDLEDQELELMERLEVAETALAAAQSGLEQARADLERARQLRDDALADIADGTTRHEAARGGGGRRDLGAAAGALRPDPHADRQHRRGDAQGPPVPGLPDRAVRQRAVRRPQRRPARGRPLRELRPDPGAHRRVRACDAGRSAILPGRVARDPAAHRRGGRRVAGQPRARPATAPSCGTPTPAGCWPSGPRRWGGRPTTSPSTAAWSPACRPRSTSTRPPRSRCGWTPSSSSSRCRAAGRSSTPTCSSSPCRRRSIARQLGAVRYTWVPRAQNGAADALANSAMDGKPVHRDAGRRGRRPRGRGPAGRRAGAASSRRSRTCCGTGRPSTPPSAGSAAVTSCRCRAPAGPRPRRPRRGPPSWASRWSSPRRCAAPGRPPRSSPRPLGLPVEFDEDLVELDFGDARGADLRRGARPSTRWPPAGSWPTSRVAAPGGESIADVSARVARARRRILVRARRAHGAGRQPRDADQAVARRRPRASATRSCTGCSWRRRRCARSPGRPTAGRRCALVNDTAHLR